MNKYVIRVSRISGLNAYDTITEVVTHLESYYYEERRHLVEIISRNNIVKDIQIRKGNNIEECTIIYE